MKILRSQASLRRAAFVAVAALFLGRNAPATWSIVIVDAQTNEVCLASATCLSNYPLKPAIAVVLVGKGAAAVQATGDVNGVVNRQIIWNMMNAGFSPAQILVRLETHGQPIQLRQYGIVTLRHDPATFTGTAVGQAKYEIATRMDRDPRRVRHRRRRGKPLPVLWR